MAKYKALVEDMVAIQMLPEDGELFGRNARMVESLLIEELAGSSAKAYSYVWLRFRGYCEEVGKEALLREWTRW